MIAEVKGMLYLVSNVSRFIVVYKSSKTIFY